MTPPPPVSASAEMQMLMRTSVGDRILVVDISDAPEQRGYVLRVRCTDRCQGFSDYAEKLGESPISLFRLSDAGPLIYSVWATGSAYRVKVYAVSDDGARRVLDASSLGGPDLLTDAAGRDVVRTRERGERKPPTARARPVDWVWNGTRLRRSR